MKNKETKLQELERKGKCPNKAETLIPWADKILKGCVKHSRAMYMLGQMIGSPLEIRNFPMNGELCEFQGDLDK